MREQSDRSAELGDVLRTDRHTPIRDRAARRFEHTGENAEPCRLAGRSVRAEEFSGFAFGLGLDRCAVIKFKPNIRTPFENDLRVLQQS
jgi:Phenylalanyl-tRNA synthetase alpha subunit